LLPFELLGSKGDFFHCATDLLLLFSDNYFEELFFKPSAVNDAALVNNTKHHASRLIPLRAGKALKLKCSNAQQLNPFSLCPLSPIFPVNFITYLSSQVNLPHEHTHRHGC
jgi:hypothetical protein